MSEVSYYFRGRPVPLKEIFTPEMLRVRTACSLVRLASLLLSEPDVQINDDGSAKIRGLCPATGGSLHVARVRELRAEIFPA